MSDFDSFFEDLKIPLHGVRLPEFSIESRLKKKYDLPDSATNYDFLIQVCRTNFKKLKIPQEERGKYTTRIKYELDAVKDLGFLDYILLVWTVINFCEENSIPVGPGRGSAAGSLILYLLRVTRVDPIKYDLSLFSLAAVPKLKLHLLDLKIFIIYSKSFMIAMKNRRR